MTERKCRVEMLDGSHRILNVQVRLNTTHMHTPRLCILWANKNSPAVVAFEKKKKEKRKRMVKPHIFLRLLCACLLACFFFWGGGHQHNLCGSELFDLIASQYSLQEKQYFGLYYTDPERCAS